MGRRTCDTCHGNRTVPDPKDPKKKVTCPACHGAGGIDTKTTP